MKLSPYQILVLKALAICINLLRASQKTEVSNSFAYQIEKTCADCAATGEI